jgi:hypothetical protein
MPVLTALVAIAVRFLIGPQVVLAVLYGFPRGLVLAMRGVVGWKFPFSYLITPAIWIPPLAARIWTPPGSGAA